MQNNFSYVSSLFRQIVNTDGSGRFINEDQYFELKTSALNKHMRYEMLKSITAFLNSHEVGVLFIGISDDKKVVGLEVTDNFRDADNYEQALLGIIKANLHDAANRVSQNLRFHFLRDGKTQKTVCAVEVRPFFPKQNEMIAWCEYLDTQKKQTQTERTFFKRTGTSTTKLKPYDVAMDMLNRRVGELSDPDAPNKDADGKPYKLFDAAFTLLKVNPHLPASKGVTKTELVLEGKSGIVRKYRNEDWHHTNEFISKAQSLIGKTVKLTSWKHVSKGDDYWWDNDYIANVYGVNAPKRYED